MDIAGTHDLLSKLPFDQSVSPSRYYHSANGDLFMMWSDLMVGYPNRLRVLAGKELPDASPSYELNGAFSVAELGAESARWVAPTYCVIYPETNLAGMIYTVEGPRPPQIAQYLQGEEAVGVPFQVDFEALANPNIQAELQRLRFIRKLELQYHPSTTPTLFRGQHADLDSVMQALIDAREAASIKIVVDAGMKGGARLDQLKDKLMDLIGRGPLLGSARKFVVTGPDQFTKKSVPVNLLTQVICATKIVPLQTGAKNLDKEAAFLAIEEAYGEHLTQFPSVEITDPDGVEE